MAHTTLRVSDSFVRDLQKYFKTRGLPQLFKLKDLICAADNGWLWVYCITREGYMGAFVGEKAPPASEAGELGLSDGQWMRWTIAKDGSEVTPAFAVEIDAPDRVGQHKWVDVLPEGKTFVSFDSARKAARSIEKQKALPTRVWEAVTFAVWDNLDGS